MQRHLLTLHHPDRQPEPPLDGEQRLQHIAVQKPAHDRVAVELAHRAQDVVDPPCRAQLPLAAAAPLDRRHRQEVHEAVELKRRIAQRTSARDTELEEQRQVPGVHPRRAQRLAAAEPKPAQIRVGDLYRLIRAVVDRPVRRGIAPHHERAKPRLVDGGKIEIGHPARR
jgi:hypothetical protein